MNLAKAIEGGAVGASTITLLQEAIDKFGRNGSGTGAKINTGLLKKIEKYEKKGKPTGKLYIELASQLLAAVSYFGITGLGKKKNAVLRGGLLGMGAGLASAFLANDDADREEERDYKMIALTIGAYTGAGMLAGAVVKKMRTKNKRRRKK